MQQQFTIFVNEDNLEQFTEILQMAMGINVEKSIVNFREFICGGIFKKEGAVAEVSLVDRNRNYINLFQNAVLEVKVSYEKESDWVRKLTGKKPDQYTCIEQFESYYRLSGPTSVGIFGYLAIHAVTAAVEEYLVEQGFYKVEENLVDKRYSHLHTDREFVSFKVSQSENVRIPVNMFNIFRSDAGEIAVGLTKEYQNAHYDLKVYASPSLLELEQNFVNSRFEEILAQHLKIRGKILNPNTGVMEKVDNITFDDIVLLDDVRHVMESNVLNFLENKDIYSKLGLQLKRGVLLHGEPGTGKTSINKAIMNMTDMTVLNMTASDIGRSKDLEIIYNTARLLKPCILIFDDVDLLIKERNHGGRDDLLGALLNVMDGVKKNDEIITILTSNNRDTLDKALTERPGRVDVTVEVGRMETEDIIKLVDIKLAAFSKSFDTAASCLRGRQYKMTGAYVTEAVIGAAREGSQKGIITEENLVKHLDLQQNMVKKKDRLGFLAS